MTFDVSRQQWGGHRPRSTSSFRKRLGVCWHWYGVDLTSDFSHDVCIRLWKQAQQIHMAPGGLGAKNGAADIAYNMGFCNHGGKFEGRGFEVANGANGNAKDNGEWLAVCWIGGVHSSLTDQAIQAMVEIRQEASHRGFANTNKPHSAFHKTSCPGNAIRSVIDGFPTSSAQHVSSSTQIVLPQQSKEDQDRFQVEVMTMEMPIVKRGVQGQFARICQGLLVANGRDIAIDGDFGPRSEAALLDFQRATNLDADGICGKVTWRRLLCI